jgi:hypothetical protein
MLPVFNANWLFDIKLLTNELADKKIADTRQKSIGRSRLSVKV